MTSHCLWRFKLISGYILSLLQGFCVYRSRLKTDRSVRSNPIHGPINGPIDWSGPTPSQKSSVLCIGLDRGPDRTEVVHPCLHPIILQILMAPVQTRKRPSNCSKLSFLHHHQQSLMTSICPTIHPIRNQCIALKMTPCAS